MIPISVRRESGEIVESTAREIKVCELETLEIVVRTGRNFALKPDVLLDGHTIGSPEVIPDESALKWIWIFRAEHWCGRTNLEVVSNGFRQILTIHSVPSGTKYSVDEYDRMLQRLRAYGADLEIGLAPGAEAAAPSGTILTRATHPAVIDHYLDDLLRQLARILRDPVRRLRPLEDSEPYFRIRHPTPRTVSWLAAHQGQYRRLMRGDLSTVVPTTRRDETFDHPANRYLVSLLRRLRRSFGITLDALEMFSKNRWNADLERQRADYLARRVQDAIRRINAAGSCAFLAGLQPGEMTETVAQVYAGHSEYGRFASAARQLSHPGLSVETAGELSASLRRSYDLFELYCLHKFAADLDRALPQGWSSKYEKLQRSALSTPASGRFWTAIGPAGERRVLYYQQTFTTSRGNGFTISQERRPDFVLVDYVAGGALKRWTLLDAKYRTARSSIHEGLKDLHVYRDSLRWSCPVTGLLKECEGAFLLVPAIANDCQEYAEPTYHELWQLGLLEIDRDPVATIDQYRAPTAWEFAGRPAVQFSPTVDRVAFRVDRPADPTRPHR